MISQGTFAVDRMNARIRLQAFCLSGHNVCCIAVLMPSGIPAQWLIGEARQNYFRIAENPLSTIVQGGLMFHSTTPTSPATVSILIGLFVLFFASGFIQQKTLDKWTQETGRAPMIHKGRGSWHRYLRSVEAEMPSSVSRRIAVWGWIGKLSMILILVALALDAAWHRN